MIKFKDILESKQVGNIYHYTDLEGLKNIVNDNLILKDLKYNRGYISFTRMNTPGPEFKKHFGAIKICIDGSCLSNRYKIIPFSYSGAINTDGSKLYRKERNSEERIYSNNVDIKKCLKYIEISNSYAKYNLTSDEITDINKNLTNFELPEIIFK